MLLHQYASTKYIIQITLHLFILHIKREENFINEAREVKIQQGGGSADHQDAPYMHIVTSNMEE